MKALTAALVLLTATSLQGQAPPDTAARRAAMERFAFLVGNWSGDAWAVVGRGQRLEMRQTEQVRFAVGGQVLVVEGVGRLLRDGVPGDTAFHAFGTIDWRPDRGYRLRSFTLAGFEGEFPVELTEDGYRWTMDLPSGASVRYVMRRMPDGAWNERGEFVRANQPGVPTTELMLRRVPPGR
ncbi:MAG: hypothetical protein AB7L66_11900 [Gemmatimonadales bacterium]